MRFFLLFIMASYLLLSCSKHEIYPSGTITSTELNYSNLQKIHIASGIEMIYTDTSWEQVIITADDNVLDYIVREQSGSTAKFSYQNRIQFGADPHVTINVYGPNVKEIDANGGSRVLLSNTWHANSISLFGSGGSSFQGDVASSTIDAIITGGSSLDLSGYTSSISLTSSGASPFENFDFVTETAKFLISGGGEVSMTINGEFTISASGGSSLIYKGTGQVTSSNLSGGSSIKHI